MSRTAWLTFATVLATGVLLDVGPLAAPPARAATDGVALSVDVGWDDVVRVGRWAPIFVTVADPSGSTARPRAVRIDLEVPQGGPNTMQVGQYAAVSPAAVMYTLYAPLRADGEDGLSVAVRDATTGKTLARWPADEPRYQRYRQSGTDGAHLVGVAGERTLLEGLVDATGGLHAPRVVQLKADRLPDQPVGYDLLDLLVLSRPNLNRVPAERQQAIADWVRAGGNLLMWPGEDPVPPGPLAGVLPCTVGRPRTFVVAPAARWRAAGQQLEAATGRELLPAADAAAIDLLADTPRAGDLLAYTRRVGFGRVVVAPFDPNHLAFPDVRDPRKFFARLTHRLGILDDEPDKSESANYSYGYGSDPVVRRQDAAVSTLQDHLGDVPGAGRFGFSYVAWVVVGMMVLVGPVDWLVLKLLGRQPWTWATTAGWIGLITAGALFIANVFKSGDLHYNTVELVDQAGDRTVARVTLAGVYAPRTATYHLDAAARADAGGAAVPTADPPPGWWDLAAVGYGYGGRGMRADVGFRQTTEGNQPQPMTINVWNLRFLRGEQSIDGGPVVRADLRVVRGRDKGGAVEGTITNLSGQTLTDVRVQIGKQFAAPFERTIGGMSRPADPPAAWTGAPGVDLSRSMWGELARAPVLVPRLGPGESAAVRAAVRSPPPATAKSDDEAVLRRGPRYYYGGEVPPPAADDVWAIAGDLAARRSVRAAAEAEAGDHAVVYARVADPHPAAVLREPTVHQKHQAVLRALIPLKAAED